VFGGENTIRKQGSLRRFREVEKIKMNQLETASVQCPYCWEYIEITVDCSIEEQEYIEDCQVCCKPINLLVKITKSGIPQIEVLQEY